ncbi:hypothetical protein LCGC14_1162330 [marine sediment metagenome]|uniref:Uncharacterized protein n=1 Tax=marine sediment metagenome TaxID=412755 RepID=A0A0F9PXU8_9ZZZZ
MSKIEEANNMLGKIRGKKFVKKHPFISEEKAEDFIESVGFTMLGSSSFLKED